MALCGAGVEIGQASSDHTWREGSGTLEGLGLLWLPPADPCGLGAVSGMQGSRGPVGLHPGGKHRPLDRKVGRREGAAVQ